MFSKKAKRWAGIAGSSRYKCGRGRQVGKACVKVCVVPGRTRSGVCGKGVKKFCVCGGRCVNCAEPQQYSWWQVVVWQAYMVANGESKVVPTAGNCRAACREKCRKGVCVWCVCGVGRQ